MRYAVVCSSRC